ncbi:hypothetical protein Clacol_000593 [Clathrus columnatus]|uniref:Zinc finger PHD-type domain-containing protein n=1 Tax=Clathrus columnatus TaxID=1419009 RepID=A0AAV4ZZ44_9AGAM|nr:hypothetical protein Clacol_000593 [Clathrus columnatus]
MDDSSTTNHTRSKRRSKVHVEVVPPPKPPPPPEDPPLDDNDDEEGGITRCVCGRTDLDADEEDLGLMVMCETCKVWQHGVCVNLPEDVSGDYYCEQCRPDLHVELLKSLKKRSRHSSQHARRHSASVPRSSRSHSPGHVLSTNPSNAPSSKPAKRRNTMNSRDAEYEDAVKQLIESTRPDSEKPTHDTSSVTHDKDDITKYEEPGVIIEIVSGARKKRKRAPDPDKSTSSTNNGTNADSKPDPPPKNKRNRSNSTTPDRLTNPSNTTITTNAQATNGPSNNSRQTSSVTSSNTKTNAAGSGKLRRGKKEQNIVDLDGSKKHPNQYTYRKPAAPTPPRRQGVNGALNGHGPSSSEQGGSSWGVPGVSGGLGGGGGGSSSRRGGNHSLHHAPLTPQQPLLTSWGLPDYLSHLASELPTDVPRPVHVRVLDPTVEPNRTTDTGMGPSSTSSGGTIPAKAGGTGGTTDPTNTPIITAPPLPPPVDDTLVLERGVKVRWPAKRTSVSDMNKRVRGIIDWVGREQAAALERRRRREALRRALVLQQHQVSSSTDYTGIVDGVVTDVTPNELGVTISKLGDISSPPESEATYLMEELMKELIAFQEKFGPGAGVSSMLGIGLSVPVSGGTGGSSTISKVREGKVRG